MSTTLVAVLVVARETGHELLRVFGLDVVEEVGRPATPQHGGTGRAVRDHDLAAAAHDVAETARRPTHGMKLPALSDPYGLDPGLTRGVSLIG